MKIAFLLSGQPRFYKEVFPYIQERILSKYDCDVYAHAWWSEDEVSLGSFQPSWSERYSFQLDPNFPEEFTKLYNPKKLLVEPSLVRKDDSPGHPEYLEKLMKLYPIENPANYLKDEMEAAIHKFISVERVYNLVEWENNYDWIFVWRYDIYPINFPDVSKFEEKGIHVYEDAWSTWWRDRAPLRYEHFIDVAFILHPDHKDMLKIATFYQDFHNNKLDTSKVEFYEFRIAERVWAAIAAYNDVKVIRHEYNDFTLHIYRGTDFK